MHILAYVDCTTRSISAPRSLVQERHSVCATASKSKLHKTHLQEGANETTPISQRTNALRLWLLQCGHNCACLCEANTAVDASVHLQSSGAHS
jgi:hypothetical protein